MPDISPVKTIEQKIVAFLDFKHVVLLLAFGAVTLFGVYIYESREVKIAEGRTAVAEAVAKQAADDAAKSAAANVQLQAQKDAIILQLQVANTTLAQANQKLTDAIKVESAALADQQGKDKQLPPTEQAKRWQVLVPSAVVVPTDAGFTINHQGGVDTLVDLEEVPVDRDKIVKLSAALANDDAVVKNDAVILQAEKDKHQSDVVNDGKQLTAAQDETKKVQAQFDEYKHKAKKNMIKSFVAGYVLGLFTHKYFGL